MKMTDQVAGHKTAGRETAGHDISGSKNTRRKTERHEMTGHQTGTLHYAPTTRHTTAVNNYIYLICFVCCMFHVFS